MTGEKDAPAEMPGENDIHSLLLKAQRDFQAQRDAKLAGQGLWPDRSPAPLNVLAKVVAEYFAPILAEKELHHATGERITRKDLNNAHRKGAEEGRLAAHLIDGVNSPLNACCYRDGCKALEARALAAEAALATAREDGARRLVLEYEAQTFCLIPILGEALKWRRRVTEDLKELIPYVAQIAAPGAAMEAP